MSAHCSSRPSAGLAGDVRQPLVLITSTRWTRALAPHVGPDRRPVATLPAAHACAARCLHLLSMHACHMWQSATYAHRVHLQARACARVQALMKVAWPWLTGEQQHAGVHPSGHRPLLVVSWHYGSHVAEAGLRAHTHTGRQQALSSRLHAVSYLHCTLCMPMGPRKIRSKRVKKI
jgi:hypothetical protein